MNLIVPLLLLGTILSIGKVHSRSFDGEIEDRKGGKGGKVTSKNLLKMLNKALKAAGVKGKLEKLLNGITDELNDLKDDVETNAEDIHANKIDIASKKDKKEGTKSALLVIDVQKCFTEGGTLAVADGDAVIPIINQLRPKFDVVAYTRDWHTESHVSFASTHGVNPFDIVPLEYDGNGKLCKGPTNNITDKVCEEDEIEYEVNQQVFVDHCIMNTPDAALNSDLDIDETQNIFVNKGDNIEVDSYSAFFDNGGFEHTEMEEELDKKDVGKLYVVGLALDYCVFWSAMDAQKLGFETFVIEDATRGIIPSQIDHAKEEMEKAGIKIITSDDILN